MTLTAAILNVLQVIRSSGDIRTKNSAKNQVKACFCRVITKNRSETAQSMLKNIVGKREKRWERCIGLVRDWVDTCQC